MNDQDKAKQIQSNWWRWLIEFLFPDKKFDGQLQNPGSERLFDFDDVISSKNPIAVIRQEIAYYPKGDDKKLFAVFISGLGQRENDSSKRSRRYAATLNTGVANMNNSSYLKQSPILGIINPYLDWIDAAVHRLGFSDSPAIENTASLILYALNQEIPLNLSGDSHGTILLARAINRAKRYFIDNYTGVWNFKRRRIREVMWEQRTKSLINVFAFGNGYRKWVKGPKYIMVSISGDPLPQRFGITPQRAIKQRRTDIKFIIFERLFPEGSFEAHNMMFTTELLRHTFVKNNIEVGDFHRLYYQLKEDVLQLAIPQEMKWSSDIKDYVWSEDSLDSIILKKY
ncbi:MAG: hypothetical protein AAF378_15905 [Cyanobacteria bacterium P01_A01_bin.84]